VTDSATSITMMSTPKTTEKSSAVGIIVAITVWVIIRVVGVGINVVVMMMFLSLSSGGANKDH
jgi:hypothetical protein